MTSRTNVTACWVALVVLALGVASNQEGHYRERAQQMEFHIVIEKLKGNEGIGSRVATVSDWRRDARFTAEAWEQIALRLSVAAAIGAVALTVTGTLWVFLFIWSGVIAASSAYLAASAMGAL